MSKSEFWVRGEGEGPQWSLFSENGKVGRVGKVGKVRKVGKVGKVGEKRKVGIL